MSLAEGIVAAEAVMDRPLASDEIAMIAQLVEQERTTADVVQLFESFERPPAIDDDGVTVWRYEPAGQDQARQV